MTTAQAHAVIEYQVTEKLPGYDATLQRERAHHFEARTLTTPPFYFGAKDESVAVAGVEEYIRKELSGTPKRVLPNVVNSLD